MSCLQPPSRLDAPTPIFRERHLLGSGPANKSLKLDQNPGLAEGKTVLLRGKLTAVCRKKNLLTFQVREKSFLRGKKKKKSTAKQQKAGIPGTTVSRQSLLPSLQLLPRPQPPPPPLGGVPPGVPPTAPPDPAFWAGSGCWTSHWHLAAGSFLKSGCPGHLCSRCLPLSFSPGKLLSPVNFLLCSETHAPTAFPLRSQEARL